MAEEPKKLEEIVLGDDLPKSLQEKFKGKSVADVLKSYEDAQKALHEQTTTLSEREKALQEKEEELARLKEKPEPEADNYDDLFGDDTYVTKEVITKELSKREEKYKKDLADLEERAVSKAMAQIERKQFMDTHPEIFTGKTPEQADVVIKKIAGAGFIAGANSLEGGLRAIQDMSSELGLVKETQEFRRIPEDLNVIGEYDNVDDEVAHFKEVHKQTRGKISSTLK